MRRIPMLATAPIFLWTLVLSSFISLGQAKEAWENPGKLKIQKARNLSHAEREVEARFAKYLEEHTDEAIRRYRRAFGKVLNTDNARELSRDYAPTGIGAMDTKTKAARSMWSNAVHEPASAFVKEIYRRELQKPAGPDELNRVIFTAGGTAAGKTTAIENMPEVSTLAIRAQIIYDTTLSDFESGNRRILQALEAGKTVSIIYIHRDPVEAFVNGVLPRAIREGRSIPLEVYYRIHLNAPQTLLKIANIYSDDPRIAISVIDNSRGRGRAIVADLEFLKMVATKYARKDLRAKLYQALEEAYEKGKKEKRGGIPENVYRAIKGRPFERIH